MQIGDRVRFWTKEECEEWQNQQYPSSPQWIAPSDVSFHWGEEATVVGFEGTLTTLQFDDSYKKSVGLASIKYLHGPNELEERRLVWRAFFEGES